MKFSVEWSRQALAGLAQIWIDHPQIREATNQAVSTVDHLLATDPEIQGESRDQGRRVMFVPPLVVIFRTNQAGHSVRVLNVRSMKRRGGG